VVLKRKLCQFCLESTHRRSQCTVESDFHHTLQRQDTNHNEPTFVQREVITAPSLVLAEVTEVSPVQLVVQEVKMEGRPNCVVIYNTGSQSTLVLNSHAKKANLKKVGVSNVYVRGMGGGTVEPDDLYEVPLVEREGGVTKIKAHVVKELIGELPSLKMKFWFPREVYSY
jgi:hypothetical protein